MKKMMKKILPLAAGVLLTVGAQAQPKIAIEGQEYVINSISTATNDAGGVRYEWYRNDVLIPACTTATCTVPAQLCYGGNVQFKRKAIATECIGANEQWAPTTIRVTFKCGGGHGTKIGNVCWAERNVGEAGSFFEPIVDNDGVTYFMVASNYYKWNSNKAWDYGISPVVGWPLGTQDMSLTWTVTPNPCPTGWRLPTAAEFQALIDTTPSLHWISSNGEDGFRRKGLVLGFNSNNCTGEHEHIYGCVLFPADGHRDIGGGGNGTFDYKGWYWSSDTFVDNGEVQAGGGRGLSFTLSNTTIDNVNQYIEKGHALSIRCVLQ